LGQTVRGHMDDKAIAFLGRAVWVSFVLGLLVILGIAMIVIPASYVMNRFIYHSGPMRTILGLIAANPIIFAVIFIGRVIDSITGAGFGKSPYLGILPIVETTPPAEEEGSYFTIFKKIWVALTEPIRWTYDSGKYEHAVEHLLLPANSKSTNVDLGGGKVVPVYNGGVCPEFLALARRAGGMSVRDWAAEMRRLEGLGVGKLMFSPPEQAAPAQ
jgi:hypothetical protein